MKHPVHILAISVLLASCGTARTVYNGEKDVNIGYMSIKKSELTSSVSSVPIEETQIQNSTSMYEYLQGRVAGVTVTPDHRIIIRGPSSINSSMEPLIIVDGAEVRDLYHINPNDVQSVDVIKDGSASIYGLRGANGVIIITTKH